MRGQRQRYRVWESYHKTPVMIEESTENASVKAIEGLFGDEAVHDNLHHLTLSVLYRPTAATTPTRRQHQGTRCTLRSARRGDQHTEKLLPYRCNQAQSCCY